MSNSEVMNQLEAAAYLKVHRNTLKEWTDAGLIRCLKKGKVIRYRRCWLDQFMETEAEGGPGTESLDVDEILKGIV